MWRRLTSHFFHMVHNIHIISLRLIAAEVNLRSTTVVVFLLKKCFSVLSYHLHFQEVGVFYGKNINTAVRREKRHV